MVQSKHLPRISKGYRYVYAPEAAGAKKSGSYKGYIFEHRLVMENYLGRPLKDDETIHHIDLNKLNNKVENLMVLSNSEHSRLHHLLKGHAISSQECNNKEKVKKVLSCEYRKCIDCGTELSVKKEAKSKTVRCINCANLHRRKVKRPDKITLIQQLTGSTMVAVAKYNGVTDNAVKKWAIQYGIDYKSLVVRPSMSEKMCIVMSSQERKKQISQKMKLWHCQNPSPCQKAVVSLTKDMHIVKEYPSATAASCDGHKGSPIARCCKGKLLHYHGLIWRYKEDLEKKETEEK